MLLRPSCLRSFKSVLSPVFTSARYKSKNRIPYPTMSAISDNDIIGRLAKLSIDHPEVLQHAPVSGIQDWKAELVKAGKGDVAVTKSVRLAHAVVFTCVLQCPLTTYDRDRGELIVSFSSSPVPPSPPLPLLSLFSLPSQPKPLPDLSVITSSSRSSVSLQRI